jgi:hypothetical protein
MVLVAVVAAQGAAEVPCAEVAEERNPSWYSRNFINFINMAQVLFRASNDISSSLPRVRALWIG